DGIMILDVVLPGNLLIDAAFEDTHLGGDGHGHADKGCQDHAHPQSFPRPVPNQFAIHHEYHRAPKERYGKRPPQPAGRHGSESVVSRCTSPNRGQEDKESSGSVCLPRPGYAQIQDAAIGLRCPEGKVYEWITDSKVLALRFSAE